MQIKKYEQKLKKKQNEEAKEMLEREKIERELKEERERKQQIIKQKRKREQERERETTERIPLEETEFKFLPDSPVSEEGSCFTFKKPRLSK
jgi:hypothetical protein